LEQATSEEIFPSTTLVKTTTTTSTEITTRTSTSIRTTTNSADYEYDDDYYDDFITKTTPVRKTTEEYVLDEDMYPDPDEDLPYQDSPTDPVRTAKDKTTTSVLKTTTKSDAYEEYDYGNGEEDSDPDLPTDPVRTVKDKTTTSVLKTTTKSDAYEEYDYGNDEEDSDEGTLPEISLSTDFAIKRLGEAINISCVSYGSESVAPRDISWELNGRVVSNLEKVYKPEMIEAKLVFRRVRLEDEGNYKCYLVQDKSSFKITNLVVNHFDGSFNCV
jgi:hypothetical protein